MATCICMAESLHCLPETITTFLFTILRHKVFLALKNKSKNTEINK